MVCPLSESGVPSMLVSLAVNSRVPPTPKGRLKLNWVERPQVKATPQAMSALPVINALIPSLTVEATR